jgi:hypothetical protein
MNKFWSEEVRYLFDLNGFYVVKGYLSTKRVALLRSQLIDFESKQDLPEPLCYGKPRSIDFKYISNIAEGSSELTELIKDQLIVELMRSTTGGYFRFNHSYSISHGLGSSTSLHMGGAPLHPRAIYMTQGESVFSSLSKFVIPLEFNTVDDGAFCVVPGSHKSSFSFGNSYNLRAPEDHPSCVPVIAEPGDIIFFTEALQHGGFANKTGVMRRSLYYCYSLGNVLDWGGDLRLKCSPGLMCHSDRAIRDVVSYKGRLSE